jgi:hypothetical protein
MNERIKELAEQAELAANQGDHINVTVMMQKFAELIVEECAKVLTQHGAYFSGDGKPYHYAASLIEEHFGVEE